MTSDTRMQALPVLSLLICAALAALLPAPAPAEEYYDKYGLSPASPALDLGVQPLGYPSGVISAVMRRDRILKAGLARLGHPLAVHPFLRGADMVALIKDERLDAGLLGDMPTILAAVGSEVWIAGLVKQTSTAIVARGESQIGNLKGRRVAYVDSSSAHHTLLQGLSSVGLSEKDVRLVPMGINDMPDALDRGEIDAFAAWEPAPSVALARSDNHRIIFRALSSDYFVISRAFERRNPEAARLLLSGFARAVEWMRRSSQNAESAARWVMADGQAFSGKAPRVTVAQAVAITRREILDIPSAPAILVNAGEPPLQSEFQFLRKLGKIPASAQWEGIAGAFAYDGLTRIIGEPRKYQTNVFDYED